MKYCVVVMAGVADEALSLFGGLTPLASAQKPCLDQLTREGLLGVVRTTPAGQSSRSDLVNLGLLGYTPEDISTGAALGRATLLANAYGVDLAEDEVAFCCNLVTVDGGALLDYRAGGIGGKESGSLIDLLEAELGSNQVRFVKGKSHGHLLIVKNMPALLKIETTAPHDILNKGMAEFLPQDDGVANGKGDEKSPEASAQKFLREIMAKSHEVLSEAEVNRVRVDLGENPGNMIWLWGQGVRPEGKCKSFKDKHRISGALVSNGDMLKGIAKTTGMTYYDCLSDNAYEAQIEMAMVALESHDLVYIHVQDGDEAGHRGDALAKMRVIETIDRDIVTPLHARACSGGLRLLFTSDHPTPVQRGQHSAEPVPFLMAGDDIGSYQAKAFTELESQRTGFVVSDCFTLIEKFIAGKI